jgi:hypothetical protein
VTNPLIIIHKENILVVVPALCDTIGESNYNLILLFIMLELL